MHVVEVTQRYPPALGGVEIHVATIARELRARGHSVTVVTSDLDRDVPLRRFPPAREAESEGVRRHRATRLLPAPHGLGIVTPGMASDLLRLRADVVHAHAFGMAPTWMAAFARRWRGIPLVVETHLDAGRGTSGWWTYARAVRRLTLDPADRVVGQTRSEIELLTRLGVPTDRLHLIPDGIDLTEFSTTSAVSRGSAPPTVLFVGRLYPVQKGLDPLVRAFAKIPPDREARLRLVGEDWGGAAIVRRLASDLGVADRVTLTGPLPRAQLLGEYARADLLALPSLFEPYGIVLTEAMAARLPVVASRVGGIPEVVDDGSTGVLVPPRDVEALAAAMERLLADAPLRARMGAAGALRVRQWSWERVIPQWIALFESVGRD